MSRLYTTPLHAAALIALLLTPLGCRIDTHKNENGKDNVDIGTPFGSMHVKTDDKATGAQTGLTPYPGATLVKKDGDDNGAADISMNFGDFKLGVHAVDLRTSDPEDKVLAFYKNDMKRYGEVLTCKGKAAVGTPVPSICPAAWLTMTPASVNSRSAPDGPAPARIASARPLR